MTVFKSCIQNSLQLPGLFELICCAPKKQRNLIEDDIVTFPLFPTPATLLHSAQALGLLAMVRIGLWGSWIS